ncbi:transcription factor E4F1 [Rhinophrynus dorsalis]
MQKRDTFALDDDAGGMTDEDDVHKCGRCQAEFTSLEEFVHHKIQKSCLRTLDTSFVSADGALNNQEVVPSIEDSVSVSQVIVRTSSIPEDVGSAADVGASEDVKDTDTNEESILGVQREMEEMGVVLEESSVFLEQEHPSDIPMLKVALNEQGRFICHMCDKTFKTANILRAHMITHSTNKDFECKLCGNSFRTKGSLIRHNRRHTDERPYVCSKCGKGFRESGALARHLRSLTPCTEKIRLNMSREIGLSRDQFSSEELVSAENPYHKVPVTTQLVRETLDGSPVIRLMTDGKGNILHEVHVQVQEITTQPASQSEEDVDAEQSAGEEELSRDCHLNQTFTDSGIVIETVTMQDIESEERCVTSSDETQNGDMEQVVNVEESINNLKTTDGTISNGEPSWNCPQCNTVCISANALKVHMKGHEGCKLYRCEVCGREFLKAHLLRKHQDCHFGERKYKCGECGKTYKTVAHVKGHMRVHSDDRPYPCPKCGKRYKTKNAQQVHARTHLAEKPYACQFCPNSFREKGSLIRHIRHHTGEKPFKCPRCGRGFAEHGTLNRHLRTKGGCMLLLSLKKPENAASAEESNSADLEETTVLSEEPHTVLVEFSSVVADTQEYIIEAAAEDSEASEAAELIQDSRSHEMDSHILKVVQQIVSNASPGQQIIVQNVTLDSDQNVQEVSTTDTITIATPESLTEQVALTLASAIGQGTVLSKEEASKQQELVIQEEVEVVEHHGEFVITSHDGDLEVQTVIV